jgi:WD40 repeat protein
MSNGPPVQPANPFRGLVTYEREDQDVLFGRDREASLLEGRLLSSSTTLLFSGSGVGKSSFLRAKFIPEVESVYTVCAYAEWAAKDPYVALVESVRRQLHVDGDGSIQSAFASAAPKPGLLVLDQFEELFQYHRETEQLASLIGQLGLIVADRATDIRLLLSMREEFLGDLSACDSVLPDLFNNYYRLRNPSAPLAATIVRKTAETVHVECDPAGLELLIQDLKMSARPANPTSAVAQQSVAPPYLQIACHGLWEKKPPAPGGVFLEGYEAGDAWKALGRYCEAKLEDLTVEEREAASDAFGYLITRGGAKRAYRITELDDLIGTASRTVLESALGKLADPKSRILRKFRDPDDIFWFELYHDMYSQFLMDWKAGIEVRRKQRREELEAELRKKQQEAEQQQRDMELQKREAEQARAREDSLKLFYRLIIAAGILVALSVSGLYTWRNIDVLRSAPAGGQLYSRVERAFNWFETTRLTAVFPQPREWWTEFWEARAQQALTRGDRDSAIIFRLKALAVANSSDLLRRKAADLVGGAYSNLVSTVYAGRPLQAATLTADGKTVVAWANNSFWAFDSATGSETSVVPMSALADDSQPAAQQGPDPRRDPNTGPEPRRRPSPITVLAFRPDGKVALAAQSDRAAASAQESLFLVDVSTGKVIGRPVTLTVPGPIAYAAFAGRGETIAVTSGPQTYFLRIKDGALAVLRTIDGAGPNSGIYGNGVSVAVSEDGSLAAIRSDSGLLRIVNTSSGDIVKRVQVRAAGRGQLYIQGKTLVWSDSWGGAAFDFPGLAHRTKMSIYGTAIGVGKEGAVVYAYDGASVAGYDTSSGKLVSGPTPVGSGGLVSLAADANTLLETSATPAADAGFSREDPKFSCRVWHLPEAASDWSGNADDAANTTYSPDLSVTAIGGPDGLQFRRTSDGSKVGAIDAKRMEFPQTFWAPDGSSATVDDNPPTPTPIGRDVSSFIRFVDGHQRSPGPRIMLSMGAAVFDTPDSCTLVTPGHDDQDLDKCASLGTDSSGTLLYASSNSRFEVRRADRDWKVTSSGEPPELAPSNGAMLNNAGSRVDLQNTIWTLSSKAVRIKVQDALGIMAFGPGPDRVTGVAADGISTWLIRSPENPKQEPTGLTNPMGVNAAGMNPDWGRVFANSDQNAIFVGRGAMLHRITVTPQDRIQITTRLIHATLRQISRVSSASVARVVLWSGPQLKIVDVKFDFSDVQPLPDLKPAAWERLLDEWQRRLGRQLREGETVPLPQGVLDKP